MDRVWMDCNGVLKLKGKRKRHGGDKDRGKKHVSQWCTHPIHMYLGMRCMSLSLAVPTSPSC
ncbi:hypothetical protein I7I48_05612 [Histoplasma ohiense]|nr:hypothetical protein I7I48_05612 [Histoplasma ohiense (nom. inval.)]